MAAKEKKPIKNNERGLEARNKFLEEQKRKYPTFVSKIETTIKSKTDLLAVDSASDRLMQEMWGYHHDLADNHTSGQCPPTAGYDPNVYVPIGLDFLLLQAKDRRKAEILDEIFKNMDHVQIAFIAVEIVKQKGGKREDVLDEMKKFCALNDLKIPDRKMARYAWDRYDHTKEFDRRHIATEYLQSLKK